jgi:hypothetical protein
MDRKKSDISGDLEDLFKKTVEINTRYIRESTELARQMSRQSGAGAGLDLFRPEIMSGAFTAFARLNLQHYQNILDLGLRISRQAVSGSADQTSNPTSAEAKRNQPAFELTGTINPEGKAEMDFLLDNTLQREVSCQFENTEFVSESDPDLNYEFETVFSPQSFFLAPGEYKRVKIEIGAIMDAVPGVYTSRVKVHGFEPLYFMIRLLIPENPTKKAGNGKQKEK